MATPDRLTARDAALQAAVMKALGTIVKDVDDRVRRDVMTVLDPGDRKSAVLPDGTKVGTVSVTEGRQGWRVVDDRAFLEWVREHRPHAIVEQVRDSDKRAILDGIRKTGEVPDGVEPTQGAPYVTVRQSDDQAAAVVDAWRSGALDIPDPLGAIEG